MNICEKFLGIPTGNIADSNGLFGSIDPDIRPIDRRMSFCGRALTVVCPAGDNLTIHKAVHVAEPGDVLLINCGGYKNAGVFGEMLAISCLARGIAAVVIDGGCRDINQIIDMNFPLYARAVCANGTTKEASGAINVPTVIGGVLVNPGDVVVGDGDGVVVVPLEKAGEVLAKALAKKEREDKLRPLLEAGQTTAELLGLMDKIMI